MTAPKEMFAQRAFASVTFRSGIWRGDPPPACDPDKQSLDGDIYRASIFRSWSLRGPGPGPSCVRSGVVIAGMVACTGVDAGLVTCIGAETGTAKTLASSAGSVSN